MIGHGPDFSNFDMPNDAVSNEVMNVVWKMGSSASIGLQWTLFATEIITKMI